MKIGSMRKMRVVSHPTECLKSLTKFYFDNQVFAYFATAVFIYILLLLRVLPAIRSSFISWEDGRLFLPDSLALPFIESLIKPYVGYYHILPRIFAQTASIENLLAVPRLYIMFSSLFAACILALPVLNIFNNLASIKWRIGFAITCAIVPIPLEILGNIACLHWYAFYGLLLLSIADLRDLKPIGLGIMVFYALITIFSSPPAVIIVPLAVLQAFLCWKNKLAVIFDAAIITFCAVFIMLCSRTGDSVLFPSLSDLFIFITRIGGFKAIAMPIFGQKIAMKYLQMPIGSIVIFCVFMVSAILVMSIAIRKRFATTCILIFSLVYAITAPILLTGITRNNYIIYFVHDGNFFGADRYFAVSIYIFILLIFMALSFVLKHISSHKRMAVLIVISALYSIPVIHNFIYEIPDLRKFNWKHDVLEYYRAVAEPKDETIMSAAWTIPIFPGGDECFLTLPPPASINEYERQKIDAILGSKLKR